MTKNTDENDDLVDIADDTTHMTIGDEWVDTPGGFCKSEIEIDDDIITQLIDQWAEQNLQPASLEQYNEMKVMLMPDSQALALHSAILNDVIIHALSTAITAISGVEVNDEE